jgi:hypothetical protein
MTTHPTYQNATDATIAGYQKDVDRFGTFDKMLQYCTDNNLAQSTVSSYTASFQWKWRQEHEGAANPEYSARITEHNRKAGQLVHETGNTETKTFTLFDREAVHRWYKVVRAKPDTVKTERQRTTAMKDLCLFYITLIGGPPRRVGGLSKPNYLDLSTWTLHLSQYKGSATKGEAHINMNQPDKFNAFAFTEEQINDARDTIVTYFKGRPDYTKLYFGNSDNTTATMIKRITCKESTLGELRKTIATVLHFSHPGTDNDYAPLLGHSVATHQHNYILRDAWRESEYYRASLSPERGEGEKGGDIPREATPPPEPVDSTPEPAGSEGESEGAAQPEGDNTLRNQVAEMQRQMEVQQQMIQQLLSRLGDVSKQ